MKSFYLAPIICVFLILTAQAQTKYVPPPDAKVVKVNGKEYLSGEVYLPGHADTLSLRQLGYRDLEYRGRSVGSVKYHALWPVEKALSEMPQPITGIDYDRLNPYSSIAEYESPIEIENPTDPDFLPEIRTFDSKSYRERLSRSGPGWQATKWPVNVWMDHDDYRKFVQGEDPYASRWIGKGNPQIRKDPSHTGTFRVLPEESGPFHKKENVGKRDPHTTGSFQLTPIETTRRSSIQVRNFSNGNPFTGTMSWGVSGYQPRDGWRGVGYHQFPISTSSPYRGIQVPRRGR